MELVAPGHDRDLKTIATRDDDIAPNLIRNAENRMTHAPAWAKAIC
jgi:hypothetical protein